VARVRYYAMLHVQVPRCWKICNDFCGGGGTIFLNDRIGRAVIFKPYANELSTRIQLNRGLAELRVHRSRQGALQRQKELRTVRNGVHVLPNDERERPSATVSRATRVPSILQRPRRITFHLSRAAPSVALDST
jgi:hypothetical protein